MRKLTMFLWVLLVMKNYGYATPENIRAVAENESVIKAFEYTIDEFARAAATFDMVQFFDDMGIDIRPAANLLGITVKEAGET